MLGALGIKFLKPLWFAAGRGLFISACCLSLTWPSRGPQPISIPRETQILSQTSQKHELLVVNEAGQMRRGQSVKNNSTPGTSLVVHWLRIHLLIERTWLGALVGELRSHMPQVPEPTRHSC